MTKARLVLLLSIPTACGLVALACESSDPTNPPGGGPDGSSVNVDTGTSDTSQPPSDGGTNVDTGTEPDSGHCVFDFWDGGPMVVPSPYRQLADSPFNCKKFATYFHVATFEGDSGLPPGTTGNGQKYPGTGQSSTITDSVDGDDGFPDGAPPDSGATVPCPGCQSYFGGSPLDFKFDGTVLGGLPTHAGLVWTDDGNSSTVTFTAYGVDGGVVAQQIVGGIGTPGISGETDEDRFFGIVYPDGVTRITISHTGGGIEIDHLQIGR